MLQCKLLVPCLITLSGAMIAGCSSEASDTQEPTAAGGAMGAAAGSGGAALGAVDSPAGAANSSAGSTAADAAGITPGAGGAGGAAAGAGGTAVAAGGDAAGGAGGAGGATAAPAGRSGPSAGCALGAVNDPINENVEHNTLGDRRYWTRLPEGYDGSTPYPLAFYGPGCGASGVEGSPLDGAIQGEAIRVFVIGTGSCFATSGGADSPEIEYFGTVLEEIESEYCTDLGRVFVSGYSSGAWLSNLLACAHGDKIRAIGTAAGGLSDSHGECMGQVAAIMHAGSNDGANPIVNIDEESGIDEGSGAARDRLLEANNCTQETQPWGDIDYCVEYQGCDPGYEVVWCEEQGAGHSNGGQVSSQGFWDFWSALP